MAKPYSSRNFLLCPRRSWLLRSEPLLICRDARDRAHLQEVMRAIILALPEADQVALICAHPALGSRTQMAPASVQEQASVGLDRLCASDYQRFQDWNPAYRDKFRFPLGTSIHWGGWLRRLSQPGFCRGDRCQDRNGSGCPDECLASHVHRSRVKTA